MFQLEAKRGKKIKEIELLMRGELPGKQATHLPFPGVATTFQDRNKK